MTGYEITILALLIGIFLFCAWAVLLLYGLVGMKEIQFFDGIVLRSAEEAIDLNRQRLDFMSSKFDALSQSIDARLANNAKKARRQRELEKHKRSYETIGYLDPVSDWPANLLPPKPMPTPRPPRKGHRK